MLLKSAKITSLISLAKEAAVFTPQVPAALLTDRLIMRGFAQFLLVLLNLLMVSSVSHQHSTRLYRASRVGGTSTKRMDPVKKMRIDDITIVDVELPAEEDDGMPLRLLAGPGVERRWAWPTLA